MREVGTEREREKVVEERISCQQISSQLSWWSLTIESGHTVHGDRL